MTRTVAAGPRARLLRLWLVIDIALVVLGLGFGLHYLIAGRLLLGCYLGCASALLVGVDLWRLAGIRRLRRLATHGRIELGLVSGTRLTRTSLAPRADGASPTGGWPFLPACEVSYSFTDTQGREHCGRFVVGRGERENWQFGDPVELFVDSKSLTNIAPTLVVRWYFKLSSQAVGVEADDPHMSVRVFEDVAEDVGEAPSTSEA